MSAKLEKNLEFLHTYRKYLYLCTQIKAIWWLMPLRCKGIRCKSGAVPAAVIPIKEACSYNATDLKSGR